MAAEWYFHNVAYDLHIMRDSSAAIDIEYTQDERPIVTLITDCLEVWGWE